MQEYLSKSIETLKEQGFRLTKPRIMVLEVLASSNHGLNAYEIKNILEKKKKEVDVATIYRIIECLEDNHLVHRLAHDSKVIKCNIDSHDCKNHDHRDEFSSHHFFICKICHSTIEFACKDEMVTAIKSFEKETKSRVLNHSIELSGICKDCN